MKRLVAKIFILVLVMLGSVTVDTAANVTANTRLRIEKLSTPTITIGHRKLKQGETFSAGDGIEWTDSKQSMVVRDLSSHALMRYSKRIFEKKGAVKSILDFLAKVNKGSTRGGNYHIVLDKSDKAALFPEKRIALVVGNQNYMYLAPLKSAQKDAEDIASTLLDLGFDVMELYETDYSELMEGINKFSGLAKDYDVALFYYAGHGIQEEGVNYLVPVDNMLERINDLRDCVSCNEVVQKVEDSGCPSKIFYFDACRDRKTTWSRSSLNGLSPMEGTVGTVITFATQSGKVAADGDRNSNSPFAKMLIKNMKEPKLSFSQMADFLVRDTYNATNPHQNPVRVGSLLKDFYFNPITKAESRLSYSMPISNGTEELRGNEKSSTSENTNTPSSQYKLAYNYFNHGNYAQAYPWAFKSASQGYAPAQDMLGIMYRKGFYVKQNDAIAVEWFQKGAEQGDRHAQYNLATMYYNGAGVRQDYEQAYQWALKSAFQGEELAQNMVGMMLRDGVGTEKGHATALYWFFKASQQGNISALSSMAHLYLFGKGIEHDDKKGFDYALEAANKGDSFAEYLVGWCYYYGKGVETNKVKAKEWIEKAAASGHEEAKKFLSEHF